MADESIALDVMGGDQAPVALIEGALAACATDGPIALNPARVILVGDRKVIERALDERGGNPGFSLEHAEEVIGMHEKPAKALRAKPRSSIAIGVGAVRSGRAGALVSMGNTGAVVGAATLGLGTLRGVRRPGIAVTLELTGRPVTIIDMGANVVPQPQHLLDYGVMGTTLMRDCLGVESPRVGLLNIGEEASKGTDLLRAAHELLASSQLRFIGNVEGGDIFRGAAEVVVADGFTGNVALKLMEGLAGFMFHLIQNELASHGVTWGPEALRRVRTEIDYSEYGGALLLGVAGVVVIGHGRSDSQAVANALRLAARALDTDVNADIVRGLEAAAAQPAPGSS